jgi:hypothetical protein
MGGFVDRIVELANGANFARLRPSVLALAVVIRFTFMGFLFYLYSWTRKSSLAIGLNRDNRKSVPYRLHPAPRHACCRHPLRFSLRTIGKVSQRFAAAYTAPFWNRCPRDRPGCLRLPDEDAVFSNRSPATESTRCSGPLSVATRLHLDYGPLALSGMARI